MELLELMLLFKLIILSSITGIIAQMEPDYENDSRCTQMKIVVRRGPGNHDMFAYALPDNSTTAPGNLSEMWSYSRIYDESLKKCISKVGYICADNNGCGTGTQCAQFQRNFHGNSSKEQLDPVKYPLIGVCICLEGMVKNPNGNVCSVGAKFGASCSQSTPCIGNMECEKNKCTCPPTRALSRVNTKYDAKEVYYYGIRTDKPYNRSSKDVTEFPRRFDQSKQRCVVESGNPCDMSARECPENQACTTTSSNYEFREYGGNQDDSSSNRYPLLGKCGCYLSDGNYVLDPTTNICVEQPKYGELCSDVLKCWPNDLSCNSGRCSCPKEDGIYDSERQKCRAPINSTCRYSEDCIRHASCEYLKGSGSCQCDTGLGYKLRNGTCVGEHLSKCTTQSDCDQGLSCIDGYCKCGNVVTQSYNKYQFQCEGLVGSECSANGIGAPKCIYAAGCKNGVCQCLPGSLVTPERKCEHYKELGSSCRANDCNYKYGWACIDNECKCIDQKLKIANGKCVSSVGSYCGYVEPVGKEVSEYPNYYFVGCENDGICDAAPKAVSICKPGYVG